MRGHIIMIMVIWSFVLCHDRYFVSFRFMHFENSGKIFINILTTIMMGNRLKTYIDLGKTILTDVPADV